MAPSWPPPRSPLSVSRVMALMLLLALVAAAATSAQAAELPRELQGKWCFVSKMRIGDAVTGGPTYAKTYGRSAADCADTVIFVELNRHSLDVFIGASTRRVDCGSKARPSQRKESDDGARRRDGWQSSRPHLTSSRLARSWVTVPCFLASSTPSPPGCAITGAGRDLACPARTNAGFGTKRHSPRLSKARAGDDAKVIEGTAERMP